MHRVPLQIRFQHRSEHQSSVTSPCHRSSQTFRASQYKMKPYFDANISPLPFPRVILSYVLFKKQLKGFDFKHFEVMKKTCLDLDWSHANKRPPPTLVLLAFEDLAVAPAEAQHQNQATSSQFIPSLCSQLHVPNFLPICFSFLTLATVPAKELRASVLALLKP